MAGNRLFVLFTLAMAGSYVLSFQIYLALPLQLGDAGGVSLLFVVSAFDRLVATHYGLYNTVAGLAITAGNVAVGALLDTSAIAAWLALATLGAAGGLAVHELTRTGLPAHPADRPQSTPPTPARSPASR
ncbi:hypothetical protein [Thermomonospora amylolytica]|uniref:hypothetical protein n=1 Tax=Thermomonospora amylolytica TaxID=1411117 RepID=UPI0018E57F26|nr:hypothetical protein [Thermomonospora amylolytica]